MSVLLTAIIVSLLLHSTFSTVSECGVITLHVSSSLSPTTMSVDPDIDVWYSYSPLAVCRTSTSRNKMFMVAKMFVTVVVIVFIL